MKKVFAGILAMAIVLSVCATAALAAGHGRCFADADGACVRGCYGAHHRCVTDGTGCGRNYVDANGDSVCDHDASGHGRGGCGFRGGRCR